MVLFRGVGGAHYLSALSHMHSNVDSAEISYRLRSVQTLSSGNNVATNVNFDNFNNSYNPPRQKACMPSARSSQGVASVSAWLAWYIFLSTFHDYSALRISAFSAPSRRGHIEFSRAIMRITHSTVQRQQASTYVGFVLHTIIR